MHKIEPRKCCGLALADELAVPQHGDAVTDGIDLIKKMRDEQNADTTSRELTHDAKQNVDFVRIEARGGFVQDQYARGHVDGPGNRDKVLHGHRIFAKWRADVDGEPEAPQKDSRVAAHFAVTYQSEPRWLPAKEQVFGNREIGQEIDLLIDSGDAELHCLLGVARHDFHAIDPDRPAIALNNPGDGLDQGRFAGAVLTQQGMNLAGIQRQVHSIKNALSQEALGQARDFEQGASLFGTRNHSPHLPTTALEAAPKPR